MAKKTRGVPTPRLGVAVEESFVGPEPLMAATIFFAASLLYFLVAFLPGRHLFGTDYLGGGYFFYHFIADRLASGSLPKWVPYIFGGMPLSANPGSTYYPVFTLGELLLPTSKVFPFLFTFQFGIAGLGMYLLTRELGCRDWVAFLGGLAFEFTGITMSWVYSGHDGRIIVATLAPLLFYFLHAGIRTARLPAFAGAAATIGFALLSFQIQTAYYLLLAGAAWAVFALVRLGVARRPRALAITVGMGLAAVAFGFMMAAVDYLPFVRYVPESPRGQAEGRGYEYSTSYSMPVPEVLSLAVPEQAGATVQDQTTGQPLFPQYHGQNGFKLHTEYVGALVLVLLALGFYFSRRDRYWWFFLGLAAVFLTIALGGNTPLYRLYYAVLPGTKRFRAPSLAFFVVAMSLVTMAALTLERLAALRDAPAARAREPGDRLELVGLISAGVVVLAVLGSITAGAAPSTPGMPTAAQGWLRFIFFTALNGGALWAWTKGSLRAVWALSLLSLVTLADLWTMDRRFFQTVPPPDEMFVADDVTTFLLAQPQPSRIWSFPVPGVGTWGGSGSYGGDLPMYFGIQQVGGEHPNPLQRWNEYVGAGTATYIDWHNLVRNPRVVGDSTGQAIAFETPAGLLDAANVRYVVSTAPLAHAQLREVYRGQTAVVYENTTALPRAYLVPTVTEMAPGRAMETMASGSWNPRQAALLAQGSGVRLPAGPLTGGATITRYEPDQVVIRTQASRAALLVLADNMYDGWRATIDGKPAEIHLANQTFRGVVVPAGAHSVTFSFDPGDLRAGFYIYLASLLALAAYGGYLLVGSRRSRRPAPAP
jgi:hypothetical protein